MTEPLPDVSRIRGQNSVTVEGAAPSAETLQQIRDDVAWLSATLAKLFAQLPGPTARSTDLAHTLGVDKPLGSRLFRIARSTDPAEAVGLLPTVNQLLRAVRTAGAKAPGAAADEAMAAAERLAAAVEELGGDQRRFESVVSATSPKGVRRVELAQRRAAFRANTHLWGGSVDCTAGVLALLPGSDPGMIDGVYVFGSVGVKATRAGVRLPLGVRPGVAEATRWTDGDGVSGRRAEPEFALFPEFSTVAPGALERTTLEDGVQVTEVTLSGVRQVDAQTVFVRQKMHNVDTADRLHSALAAAFVTWPTEVLQLDLALPAGMATAGTLRQWVYANREEPSASRKMRRRDRSELHEDVMVYRDAAAPPASAEVAFMPAMFSATMQWLKRGPMKWDVFRLRVEYPVLHSLYAVTTACGSGRGTRP